MQPGYVLPPIDQRRLVAELKDAFPNHKHPATASLLHELVHAYQVWWLLMTHFPERKIAGPVPLWYVRQVHASDMERFFFDCYSYLGRLPQKTDVWSGEEDFEATMDTARSLRKMFDYPDMIWEPILRSDEALRSATIIRIH
jgi:hypothetical protein